MLRLIRSTIVTSVLGIIEATLEMPGSELTIVIWQANHLIWATQLRSLFVSLEMGMEVVKSPNVLVWYERLSEREAFWKEIMVPFNELKGRRRF
jgi:hypothetical protein